MKNAIVKNSILFIVGYCVYITIEVLFRGYSFPVSGLMGGIAMVLLDKINDKISWDIDIIIQCAAGALLVTAIEFVIGSLSLHGFLPITWNYSDIPFNYKGIICLPFSVIWFFLSFVGILLSDAINYYVMEDTDIPYYKLFGKTILKFKKKKCAA